MGDTGEDGGKDLSEKLFTQIKIPVEISAGIFYNKICVHTFIKQSYSKSAHQSIPLQKQ